MACAETVLSRKVVEEILKTILEEENIKYASIKIEPGRGKGDGYLSVLTKVDVTSDGNPDLNLIIKSIPDVEPFNKMRHFKNAFSRELYFYNTIVVSLNEFQKQRGISEILVNVPKCYKTSSVEGKEFLVLENIKMKRYKMIPRHLHLYEEHITVAFKRYAKYHSVSLAMKNLDPVKFDDITGILEPLVDDTFVTNTKILCDTFFNEEIDEYVSDAIVKFLIDFKDFILSMKTHKSKHSVILHGDCWSNNVLYKYEAPSKPGDTCLLDFQMSFLGSPAIDLCNFFLSMAPEDTLNNYKHYLKIYHDDLKTYYLKLGGNIKDFFTYDVLLGEWKIYARYGFAKALFLFRAMMCEKPEVLDFNDLITDNIPITDMFINREMTNDYISENLSRILAKYMYNNGLF